MIKLKWSLLLWICDLKHWQNLFAWIFTPAILVVCHLLFLFFSFCFGIQIVNGRLIFVEVAKKPSDDRVRFSFIFPILLGD